MGSTSSKGRTHGQVWMVQLRRRNDVLIVAIGLPRAAADTLAERINEFLRSPQERSPNGLTRLSPNSRAR